MPFRPLETFPALGGRCRGKPQRSSLGSEGDTSAEPAGPIPSTPPHEVPATFLRRAPPPHPRCQGVSKAAGPLHLALSAPSTRSGSALASRFGPAAKGRSPGGPALACPLVARHLGSSPLLDPSIAGRSPRPAGPALGLHLPARTANLCCVRRSLRLRRRWRPRLVQETGRGRHASHTRLPAQARPAMARPGVATLPG